MEQKTCCFTGHRKIPPVQYEIIKRRLREEIVKRIGEGFVSFLCGGALGFDTMAAKEVLCLKETYPHIRLVLALPCQNQTRGWAKEDIAVYEDIIRKSNQTFYTSMYYTRDCMLKRNRFLIDKSSVCICYLTNEYSGTGYTVSYALSKGKKVVRIDPGL